MEINEVVLKAIDEKKGYDIFDYDVKEITPFFDHVIICSTQNIRQNNAIAQNIRDRLKEAGWNQSFLMEGNSDSKWILLDLKETIVHLFVQEERQVYQLDRLYCDVPVVRYDL
ncbi:MAG: ribosome silencing factor [Floccifex sp.]